MIKINTPVQPKPKNKSPKIKMLKILPTIKEDVSLQSLDSISNSSEAMIDRITISDLNIVDLTKFKKDA